MNVIRKMCIFCTASIILLSTPVHAIACGLLVSEYDTNVRPEHMDVALFYDEVNGTQDLLIEINYVVNQGSVNDFGWVMPFPAQPTIQVGNQEWFDILQEETKYKESLLEKARDKSIKKLIDDWVSDSFDGHLGDMLDGDTDRGVSVTDQTQIGIYDTATVQAIDQDSLFQWAEQNGFHLAWEDSQIIDQYIEEEWYFVLIKADAQDTTQGDITPLLFTIETTEPIYPLLLSALDRDGEANDRRTTPITLYLIGQEKLAPMTYYKDIMSQEYGGNVQHDIRSEMPVLEDASVQDLYVTKWDKTFYGDDITSDLYVQPAPHLEDLGTGGMSMLETLSLLKELLLSGFIMLPAMLIFSVIMIFKKLISTSSKIAMTLIKGNIILYGVGAFIFVFIYKDFLLWMSQLAIICVLSYVYLLLDKKR